MTVPEVAKYLGIKRQSVQSTVNQMKKRGLINLRKNPNHKTSPLVILTKKGNDKVDDIFKYQKKLTEVFIKGTDITMKDVVSSREFLRALRENSEKNIAKLN